MSAPVSGLLLTGGSSRRLGVDKAMLELDGSTLAERAATRLGAVCDIVVEVGRGVTGLPRTREDPPGSGPLAALAAGGGWLRERGHTGSTLVLAVDLPDVDVSLLRFLGGWPGAPTAVPEAAGQLQAVCARYGADALLVAQSLVVAGVRSLHALLDVVEHDVVDERAWGVVASADAFADVDTARDAARRGIDLIGLP